MSMRWKPYPSYRDSGVEWLGRIPGRWQVLRADAVLQYRKEQARRQSFHSKRVFHYSIPAIQETGDGREEDGDEIDSDKISLTGSELLVSKLNPRKGCVLISKSHDLPVVCSTEFVPLKAKGCELRFAYYLYASQPVRDLISSTVQSVTRSHQRANPADIVKIWLAFPPDVEQAAIASFLDRETAKIDALVAKKERLIELLQEKRTALISHAVTQGLNPDAPKRDSGIPWLGRIPAHWCLSQLRHAVVGIKNGTTATQLETGTSEYRVTRIETISRGVIDYDKIGYLERSASLEGYRLEVGDILLSHINSLEMVGNCAVYNGEFPLYSGMNLLRIRPSRTVTSRFLWNWLRSALLRQNIQAVAKHAINQVSVPIGSISALPVLLPPMDEQQRITAFLDAETAKLDALTAKVRTAVERLQEYRTALISAAVTGQIDVRGSNTATTP